MVRLFRQIIQQNPIIEVLDMYGFSDDKDRDASIGEHVLEALLSSSMNSITDLYLYANQSWFKHPDLREENNGNVELLAQLLIKHASIQNLNLGYNRFYSKASKTILTTIARNPSTQSKLKKLNLEGFNYEIEESCQSLAEILHSASNLKNCEIHGQRQINVKIQYATDEEIGCIKIFD